MLTDEQARKAALTAGISPRLVAGVPFDGADGLWWWGTDPGERIVVGEPSSGWRCVLVTRERRNARGVRVWAEEVVVDI